MSKFEKYLRMTEEANMAITVHEINSVIKKYRLMPRGIAEELQSKLDAVNFENRLEGKGITHLIHTRHS